MTAVKLKCTPREIKKGSRAPVNSQIELFVYNFLITENFSQNDFNEVLTGVKVTGNFNMYEKVSGQRMLCEES